MQDKVKVRRHVLNLLPSNPRILDAFCGSGEMWREAYGKSVNYVGLDEEIYSDERTTIVCDNRRYLRMADLDQFDLFDLDAYGSPFEQYAIICSRIRWTRTDLVGFVMTDGTGMNSRFNAMNREFLQWVGARTHLRSKVQMEHREDFILAGLLKGAETANGTLENVLVAAKDGLKSGSDMRYLAFVMRQIPLSF